MPKCPQCGKEFATDAALAQHTKDKHASSEPLTGSTRKEKSKPKSLRRRNKHPVAVGLGAAGAALLVVLYLLVAPSLVPPPVPCSSGENWVHIHPYLTISIEGTNVPVPAAIGSLKSGSCLEVMHTHDSSGIIHIELAQGDTLANYTLADFFRVWNATYPTVNINGTSHPVTFSNNEVFGYRADATHKVVVLVDAKVVSDGVKVPLEQLDYCDSTNGGLPPCQATANGNPLWKGTNNYPYGTGHTITIEYTST